MVESSPVLVIGATNVDILCEYDASVADTIDKPGTVEFAVGGTAFNIAANLSDGGVPVRLYTHLNATSPFTDLIQNELDRRNIDTSLVGTYPDIPENAFVAFQEDGDLASAVTSSGLGEKPLDTDALRRAATDASLIIADCNLTASQLEDVAEIATEFDRPLFIAGVSESKVSRFQTASTAADVLFINEHEAAAIDSEVLDPEDVNATELVITRGADGFEARGPTTTESFAAPALDDVVSTLGAGDALLSGVAHSVWERGTLEWDQTVPRIHAYLTAVLSQEAAARGGGE